MRRLLQNWLNPHYRHPHGWVGWYVGHLMTRQHTSERRWTIALLPLHPAAHILEIGFGAGEAIAELAPKLPEGVIVGVDRSATMVALARRRNVQWIRQGRVSLQEGGITELPCEDGAFDSVFSIHTVYFWPDTLDGFRELHRVLVPGGMLVCTYCPGEITPSATSLPITEWEQHLMQDMRQAGFREVERKSGPPSRKFANAALCGWK